MLRKKFIVGTIFMLFASLELYRILSQPLTLTYLIGVLGDKHIVFKFYFTKKMPFSFFWAILSSGLRFLTW